MELQPLEQPLSRQDIEEHDDWRGPSPLAPRPPCTTCRAQPGAPCQARLLGHVTPETADFAPKQSADSLGSVVSAVSQWRAGPPLFPPPVARGGLHYHPDSTVFLLSGCGNRRLFLLLRVYFWVAPRLGRHTLLASVCLFGVRSEYSSTRPNISESHSETPEHERIP